MEAEQQATQEEGMRSGTFDPNVTPSESSFAPENAAVSSTPMVHASAHKQTQETHELWAASVESPLKRLGEGIKSLGEESDSIMDNSKQASGVAQQSMRSETSSMRSPVFKAPEKGKGKAPANLRQNVLLKNVRGTEMDKLASPAKVRKTPKKNPYVPPDISRADWDGIVDLTKPATPRRAPGSATDWTSDGDSTPSPKLSPPRSAFAKRIAHIGRTPVREAAARIGRDLIGDAERLHKREYFGGFQEPSLSATPSTPSLSVYTRQAVDVEGSEHSSSMSQNPGGDQNTSSTANAGAAVAQPSVYSMAGRFATDMNRYDDERIGIEADDTSFDSFDATPGPVFPRVNLLPEDGAVDDSMDSSFDDSFDMSIGAQNVGPAMHQYANIYDNAQMDDGFDDSIDDDDDDDDMGIGGAGTSTVFGLHAEQRYGGNNGQLQLLGHGMTDDTTALNSHLRSDVGPETPTPWTGHAQGGSG